MQLHRVYKFQPPGYSSYNFPDFLLFQVLIKTTLPSVSLCHFVTIFGLQNGQLISGMHTLAIDSLQSANHNLQSTTYPQ